MRRRWARPCFFGRTRTIGLWKNERKLGSSPLISPHSPPHFPPFPPICSCQFATPHFLGHPPFSLISPRFPCFPRFAFFRGSRGASVGAVLPPLMPHRACRRGALLYDPMWPRKGAVVLPLENVHRRHCPDALCAAPARWHPRTWKDRPAVFFFVNPPPPHKLYTPLCFMGILPKSVPPPVTSKQPKHGQIQGTVSTPVQTSLTTSSLSTPSPLSSSSEDVSEGSSKNPSCTGSTACSSKSDSKSVRSIHPSQSETERQAKKNMQHLASQNLSPPPPTFMPLGLPERSAQIYTPGYTFWGGEQFRGPWGEEQLRGPGGLEQFRGPGGLEQFRCPTGEEQFGGPRGEKQYIGPLGEEQCRGPGGEEQFRGPLVSRGWLRAKIPPLPPRPMGPVGNGLGVYWCRSHRRCHNRKGLSSLSSASLVCRAVILRLWQPHQSTCSISLGLFLARLQGCLGRFGGVYRTCRGMSGGGCRDVWRGMRQCDGGAAAGPGTAASGCTRCTVFKPPRSSRTPRRSSMPQHLPLSVWPTVRVCSVDPPPPKKRKPTRTQGRRVVCKAGAGPWTTPPPPLPGGLKARGGGVTQDSHSEKILCTGAICHCSFQRLYTLALCRSSVPLFYTNTRNQSSIPLLHTVRLFLVVYFFF